MTKPSNVLIIGSGPIVIVAKPGRHEETVSPCRTKPWTIVLRLQIEGLVLAAVSEVNVGGHGVRNVVASQNAILRPKMAWVVS